VQLRSKLYNSKAEGGKRKAKTRKNNLQFFALRLSPFAFILGCFQEKDMITGNLNLFTEAELDKIHEAAMTVLEKVGIKVYHDRMLESLARSGAQVDFAARNAKIPAKIVESIVSDQKKRPFRPDREVGEAKGEYTVAVGGVIAPFYYDYDKKERRRATQKDLIELLHFGDALGSRVGLPVTMSDVDGRAECIEALALQIEHTHRPAGTYVHRADQVPYVMRIAEIYGRDKLGASFGGPSFITSPLTIGMNLGDLIFERAKWGVKDFSIGVMPISGGNAPVTMAGNIVLSIAEAFGGWAAVKSVVPEARLTTGACNGTLDMRRGTACWNSPEALLQDLGFCEVFRRRYGGHARVAAHSDYIEAKSPGLQAVYERALRATAIAAFVGNHFRFGGNGTLDGGRVFSPVELMLEKELGDGLWKFAKGIPVTDETLAVEAIMEVGAGEGKAFTDIDHTVRLFRQALWHPRLMDRSAYESDEAELAKERRLLEGANDAFHETLKRYQPPDVDRQMLAEIWKVVDEARRELMK
jgi:trimethylamine--corrinoid protein Co-methyltransferase